MAATKVFVNWSGVEFGSTAITQVTTGSFGYGGKLIKFKADVSVLPTVIAAKDIEPHASFTTADAGVMMGFTPGSVGTLTATLKDALGATGSDCTFILSNAVFENADTQAQHAQWGTITGTWQAYSTDGVTNPLAVSGP